MRVAAFWVIIGCFLFSVGLNMYFWQLMRDSSQEINRLESNNSGFLNQIIELQSSLDESAARLFELRRECEELRSSGNRLLAANSELSRLLDSERLELRNVRNLYELQRQRQVRLEEQIISARRSIRIRTNSLTDVPPASASRFFAETNYESLRQEYNDLVFRFNALVARSNELVELISDLERELQVP